MIKLRGGSAGKILFLAFLDGRTLPDLCLKVSAFVGENSLIESEFNNLKEIRDALPKELKTAVPEPYFIFNMDGYAVAVEEAVNARQPDFNLGNKDLKKIFDWLCAFHKASILEEKEINKDFLIEFLSKYGDKKAEAVNFVEKNWNFGSVKIPLIKQHGDFHFANVFFQNDGLKVIDWGNYGNIILPTYDLIFFLRRQKGELAPGNEFLIEYFRRFSIPQETFLFWLDLCFIIENLEKWQKRK